MVPPEVGEDSLKRESIGSLAVEMRAGMKPSFPGVQTPDAAMLTIRKPIDSGIRQTR